MVILSQELREAAQKIAFFQYESEKGFSPLNGSDGWNNRGHHEEQSQDAQMFPAGSKIAVESWNCLNFPYDRRDATGWHSEGQRKLEQDFWHDSKGKPEDDCFCTEFKTGRSQGLSPGQEGLSIHSQNQVKLIRKNLNISLHYTHGENTRYLNWCTSLITSVQSLHVPEVMRHHDTMRNTVLGRGVTNVSQRQIGETLAYKLPELPKGVGFLKRKPKLHSQLLFPVLTTQVW